MPQADQKGLDAYTDAAFAVLAKDRQLRSPLHDTEARSGLALHGDIRAFVAGDARHKGAEISALILKSPLARRIFDRLRAERQRAMIPALAAAKDVATGDTGSLDREMNGIRLKIRQSNAETTQRYVILELAPICAIADGEVITVILDAPGMAPASLAFPAIDRQRSTRLLAGDDPAVALLERTDCRLDILT